MANNQVSKVAADHPLRDVAGELPRSAQPIEFAELDHAPAAGAQSVVRGLGVAARGQGNPLHQVRTRLTVNVGSIETTVGELLAAKEQHVLTLDRQVDQPVDLLLEGQVVARGILVAVGDYYGVRVTELSKPLNP